MTNPLAAPALLTLAIIIIVLVSFLQKADPIVLFCRYAYAFRRAVFIVGSMLWDSAGEFKYRWESQRPADAETLRSLEAEFPAGSEID